VQNPQRFDAHALAHQARFGEQLGKGGGRGAVAAVDG
jgi:hypothetical protein